MYPTSLDLEAYEEEFAEFLDLIEDLATEHNDA